MLRYSVIAYFAFATALHAQTIYVNSRIRANWSPGVPPGIPPHLTVDISKNGREPPPSHLTCVDCDTQAGLAYDGERIKVWINGFTADEGSDWFLVQPGDTFSRAAINAGLFPTIVNYLPPPRFTLPWQLGEVTVGSGEFYLGVSTGKASFTDPDKRPRTAYGWVHLRPVNGMLTMVENVMAYDSRGIIVGTTTVVPEPAAWAPVTMAALTVLSRRRRNSKPKN